MTGRPRDQSATHYRTATVDGVGVFYREAGPPDAPVVVLLHGFPSSSRMFRGLIPRLSDAYHVIAPDYPGFGHSAVPGRADFAHTFDSAGAGPTVPPSIARRRAPTWSWRASGRSTCSG